jgi:hypothetical protein
MIQKLKPRSMFSKSIAKNNKAKVKNFVTNKKVLLELTLIPNMKDLLFMVQKILARLKFLQHKETICPPIINYGGIKIKEIKSKTIIIVNFC